MKIDRTHSRRLVISVEAIFQDFSDFRFESFESSEVIDVNTRGLHHAFLLKKVFHLSITRWHRFYLEKNQFKFLEVTLILEVERAEYIILKCLPSAYSNFSSVFQTC